MQGAQRSSGSRLGASDADPSRGLSASPLRARIDRMERIANKARGFAQARAWELEQERATSPDERRRIAKALRDRVYGTDCPDVRDAFAGLRRRRKR